MFARRGPEGRHGLARSEKLWVEAKPQGASPQWWDSAPEVPFVARAGLSSTTVTCYSSALAFRHSGRMDRLRSEARKLLHHSSPNW
jgi:hypothetical protein